MINKFTKVTAEKFIQRLSDGQVAKLGHLNKLIDAFTKWAEQFKVVDITAGDIGINIDRTRKLYEHLGFTQGLWMIKEMINE
jgi:hypothetical protein